MRRSLRVIAARTGRGRCAGLLTFFVKRFTISEKLRLLAPPVRLWSMKAAVAWLYSSLGNQPEIKRLFIESEFVSLDFHSAKYFVSGFALCFDIIVMSEHGDGCIVYTV
jgi:hypothetical protein